MKKIFVTALTAVALLSGTNVWAGKKVAGGDIKNGHDSTSYALGVQVGMSLKGQLTNLPCNDLNMDLFIEALSYCMKNNDTTALQIKPSQTPLIINTHMQAAQEEMNKKDKIRNDAFLANNAKQPGVITTSSGLQYMILKDGESTERPKITDKVKVNYTGKLIDGKVFDSNEGREPVEFELNKVIKGWTEGLQLMTIGSKFRFWVPAELGYGSRPINTIPANSILIFDVDLLDIGRASSQPQTPPSKFSFKPYNK